ncbi:MULTISPECIES: hypothetical protein [Chryseobacterium]|uniref:hypothetical protein n=1 Tax=Chryseobacterium TaxID=59732 RepID=UPI000D3D1974|nr:MULTISPECIES: hypothetical protein [Chryseobacterium]PTT77084.1 hypothetical protein DBR25_04115 [Chryseobacterium sp. HMWF001]PVV59337.1 hypothetical protein DD829_06165 [Chryseobacterium sp. HMWF035]WBX96444.1 hypothetical protein PE065_16550 [Chryseobacterium gambrini]
MKKLLLALSIVTIGFANAKNIDKEKKEVKRTEKVSSSKKAEKKLKMQCYEWALYVWCKDQFFSDMVCWGEGSGTATHAQAVADEIHNSQLLTEYFCGAGTQHGWGTNGPN